MLIHSDWHMHSDASYDSSLSLPQIAEAAQSLGLRQIGITDHVNFNDRSFLGDLRTSVQNVTQFQATHPHFTLGVELTPIEKPEFDYIAKHGVRDGYVAPDLPAPYGIELAQTKEELMALGVRYAIGASHWRVDTANAKKLLPDLQATIREWHRQQLWMACDERVTILGHPWYHGRSLWYGDFSLVPHSMHDELAAALKQHSKYVECNAYFFVSDSAGEKFRHQYAEFLRELFERGIPVVYGSDAHNTYDVTHIPQTEKYLYAAGFADGDISSLSEKDFWF